MDKLIVHNPFNREPIGELGYHSESQVREILERAQSRFKNKKFLLTKVERIKILKRFHELLLVNRDRLIELALREGGKPFRDSVVEIDRGINGVEVAMESLNHLAGHEIPMNITPSSSQRFASTFFEPRGVVVAVSAFNHPFNLIIHQVIPAVAAGCPVIVKPASTTPLSCVEIVKLLHQAGLDEDLCQWVIVKNDVAERLVSSPGLGFFSFIGSAKVGWYLRSKLAPGVTCALEHGGLAPLIVDESAKIDECVNLVTKGGYYHAGQVCVSVQRIYTHQKIHNDFVEKLNKKVSELKVGDAAGRDTDVGPLITPNEVERVSLWVEEAINAGAKKIKGDGKLSETLYSPTILQDIPIQTTLGQNEIFGPVVGIKSFQNLEEVVEEANSLDVAFQASIFTQDIDRAYYATRALEAQAVMVNDHTAFRVDWMPFGGYKNSGLGLGGIPHSIKDMSIEKLMVIKSPSL